ncbi:hypothetical protein CONCODRAFT_15241 [Conidiobolus coronatus NRRL 28638]|uniref:Putative gamma-glutamylcyclotransferase n=1 Tax=Conidiobolus coronatus (strain ATCC 28846 / CBS 209.66 / NRRL 28638) TaxID=796925 RepID=A0A137PFI1_CONC2|nr:hypothetical protein CONCODRAFT_15241 [Conidiobolus coronatus NRRL 28638]|eukprot:KXN73759.1 hypothetical protein CONCODRAFT_15241 [Conidiobolus coronatus NRRL 28638]
MNVFVYGTLMTEAIFDKVVFTNENQVRIIFKRSEAVLKDYKRFTAPNRDYPGILPLKTGSKCYKVRGILIEGLFKHHIEALDYFEGPEYKRVPVLISSKGNNSTEEKLVYADTYIWKEELSAEELLKLPEWDDEYFKNAGAKDWINKRENFYWD